MTPTKAQQEMIDAGYPASLFWTQEERRAYWEKNPPTTPQQTTKVPDAEALKQFAETIKTKPEKKTEDRTGQRWNAQKSRWEKEQPVISITTNTRGATKMKDFAEMNLNEMATAYNKISGKPPIKKFKDKATGLKKLAEAKSKPAEKPKSNGVSPLSEVVRKAKAVKPEGSANKRAAEFGARVGSFREKLLIALDEHFKKQVALPDLLKAVYGSKNTDNAGALTMVLKGAQTMIEKNKLPYTLKKEKNDAKELSYGLYAK